jgi:hypothetical protein
VMATTHYETAGVSLTAVQTSEEMEINSIV